MIKEKQHIRLKDVRGKWSAVEKATIQDTTYYLLENDVLGDELPCIIINQDNTIIELNWYDDLILYLEENDYYSI